MLAGDVLAGDVLAGDVLAGGVLAGGVLAGGVLARGARRLAGARLGVAVRSLASSWVIASSEPWRAARRSSRRSTPSSIPSRRWETDRRRRVRRSMSEADGMLNAPKATS